MKREAERDPFAPYVLLATRARSEEELEARWFARAPIRSSRPPPSRARGARETIDDPVADTWFR